MMTDLRRLALLACAAFTAAAALPSASRAQSTPHMPSDSLAAGMRVRISASIFTPRTGVIQSLRGDTLVFLGTEGSEHSRLLLDQIPFMEVSQGRGLTFTHVLKDAAFGALAGIVAARALQLYRERDQGDICTTVPSGPWCGGRGVAKGIAIGAAVGVLVAVRHPGERWREVRLR